MDEQLEMFLYFGENEFLSFIAHCSLATQTSFSWIKHGAKQKQCLSFGFPHPISSAGVLDKAHLPSTPQHQTELAINPMCRGDQ